MQDRRNLHALTGCTERNIFGEARVRISEGKNKFTCILPSQGKPVIKYNITGSARSEWSERQKPLPREGFGVGYNL